MEEGKILHIFVLIFEAMKNPGTESYTAPSVI